MSTVAHRHKINRRHVHFPALNWEEEQQRANRGVAIRRELRREQRQRKHRQKMDEQRRESDRRRAFLVLRNPGNADRILRLCDEARALAANVNLFLVEIVGENPRPQQLEEFRSYNDNLGMNDGDLYDWMRNEAGYAVSMDFLFHISVDSHFRALFLSDGVVVSDDSIITRTPSNDSQVDSQPNGPDIFNGPIDNGERQDGGMEEPPVGEVEVRGNHVVNQVANQPAPVDAPYMAADDGGVEEPPVGEAEAKGNDVVNQPENESPPENAAHAAADDGGVEEVSVAEAEEPGNDVVNQPENEPAPENAAYGAAGADNDNSRGSKRDLSPQANWTDNSKKQRTDS